MKSFSKAKLLGCILLSSVIAFGNVAAIPNNFLNKGIQTEVYASTCFSGTLIMETVRLNSKVSLTGEIRYTYHKDSMGNMICDSIDGLDTWIINNDGFYEWAPGDYNYTISIDGRRATISFNGYLLDDFLNTADYIVKYYNIRF